MDTSVIILYVNLVHTNTGLVICSCLVKYFGLVGSNARLVGLSIVSFKL
jgi:hypothetical protein